MDTDGTNLKLAECNDQNESQKWIWTEFYY